MRTWSEIYSDLADEVNLTRMKLCAYYASEDQACACEYGIDITITYGNSKKTGCPELRDIVRAYRQFAVDSQRES